MKFAAASITLILLTPAGAAGAQKPAETVAEIFSPASEVEHVMTVEAAIARAQAAHGVIPLDAAAEISEKATIKYAPLKDIAKANDRLHHRMEALLFVWRSRLSRNARASLHYGATTVDIYDTALSLQISEALDILIAQLDGVEAQLAEIAAAHRDTPMVGRTLGQHALPMTFGKKVAGWIGELDRHRERLCQVRARVDRSIILKGPVGSYAGLGPDAVAVEETFAAELGKPEPYADDWHGARDVYAEAALNIALLSRSFARMGQEVFLLQSTDVGEVYERLDESAVSSSSMPQKVNPVRSEALIHYGRTLPREAEVLLDDVVNFYERDNTARPNAAMGALLVEAEDMLETASALIARLTVNENAMRANLEKSGPLLRAQAVTQALTGALGREPAAAEVKAAAKASHETGVSFADALMARPAIAATIEREDLLAILDPLADLAGAGEEVDAVLAAAAKARAQSCAIVD